MNRLQNIAFVSRVLFVEDRPCMPRVDKEVTVSTNQIAYICRSWPITDRETYNPILKPRAAQF